MTTQRCILAVIFCLLAIAVLVLALVPGSLGAIIANDIMRHGFAFFTLTMFALFAWPAVNQIVLLTGLSLLGGSIEILQGIMAYGRQADWLDWLVDIIAIIATLLAIRMIRIRWHGRMPAKPRPA